MLIQVQIEVHTPAFGTCGQSLYRSHSLMAAVEAKACQLTPHSLSPHAAPPLFRRRGEGKVSTPFGSITLARSVVYAGVQPPDTGAMTGYLFSGGLLGLSLGLGRPPNH